MTHLQIPLDCPQTSLNVVVPTHCKQPLCIGHVSAPSPGVAFVRVQVLQEVTGKPTLYYREGGTIPAMALLKKELGIDMTMFAFGLPDDRIHAPNERYAQPLWV